MIPKFVKTGHDQPAPNARKVTTTCSAVIRGARPSIPKAPTPAMSAAMEYGSARMASIRSPQNRRTPTPNAAPMLRSQPDMPSPSPASTPDATSHEVRPPAENERKAPPIIDQKSARRVDTGLAVRRVSTPPGSITRRTRTRAEPAIPTPRTNAERQPSVSARSGTVAPLIIAAVGMPDCLSAIARPSRGRRARVRARFTAVWFAALTTPHTASSATITPNDSPIAAINP